MRMFSRAQVFSDRAQAEPVEASDTLRQAQGERLMCRIAAITLLGLAVAACTPNDTTLGGALRHDIAMQTIDPEPTYAGSEIEGGSGTHGAAAMERYRKGAVKEPQSIKTTSGSGSGSGGSGGGSK